MRCVVFLLMPTRVCPRVAAQEPKKLEWENGSLLMVSVPPPSPLRRNLGESMARMGAILKHDNGDGIRRSPRLVRSAEQRCKPQRRRGRRRYDVIGKAELSLYP